MRASRGREPFGPAVACLLFAACGSQPQAWHRSDLVWAVPEVRGLRGPVTEDAASRRQAALLGPAELGAEGGDDRPLLEPARIDALVQAAGTELAFEIDLGQVPSLSFVALGAAPDPCAGCESEVVVRGHGARETAVWRGSALPPGRAPAELGRTVVDLAAFAGRSVEVVLRFRSSGVEAAWLWGAPEVVWRAPPLEPPAASPRPNVLLLGLDTVRADALGAWGRTPSVTPALDDLASESDVWLVAFSTFNMTNPSFASILTGRWGREHGVFDNRSRLRDDVPTLAEILDAEGYRTGAFLAAPHLKAAGLDRGFEAAHRPRGHLSGRAVVDRAMEWIAGSGGPFFAWVHLFDAHTPHSPPGPYALGRRPAQRYGLGPVVDWEAFREPGPRAPSALDVIGHRDLYLGEVAYLDRQVDRLLSFLEGRGLLERTVVAVVGDHGENLEEHGFAFRHQGLWDATTHVPLMVRAAGAEPEGRRFDALVQTLDLFPTLLEAADVEPPRGAGRSLLVAAGEEPSGRRVVFADLARPRRRGDGEMARTRRWKLFRSVRIAGLADGTRLYDLTTDPTEVDDLAGGGLPAEERLLDLLDRWSARVGVEGAPLELTAEEVADLRALGYLD